MSFTREVKRELSAVVPDAAHCRRAQLSGLVFGAGTFAIASGGRFAVRLTLSLPAVARHTLALLKPFGVEAEVRTVTTPPAGRRYEVVIGAGDRDVQLLNELGVLSDALHVRVAVPRRVVDQRCCRVAFARGLFLGCGTISAPGAAVHVEFTVSASELAEQLRGLLARLGLEFHVVRRDRNLACYAKRAETAADLLALLGAHDARLRWEEHAVLGEMRARANRLANCDAANARRAAAAGERQAAAARHLMAAPVWPTLPRELRELAVLRLEYPYLSLAELAARARPPLSRAAADRRLRRLLAIAGEEAGA